MAGQRKQPARAKVAASKVESSKSALESKVDACHICCEKLEKEIAALKSEIKALKAQPVASAKDPRVDELISVLRNSVPKFQKKWSK